ncbi:major paralogous domain-containing protein [Fibrobacter sp. UWT3]|uniref:FISUMP domain-containing protein n=1 Tax=Fibrobacter sp. UWT3 TaxID=1896225 RepID=UPI000BD5270F|nr:FISUMP domain-containing protein [Fibrobacter sp. UWT3]SOE53601.1 major paralogous domain-containing protein [Fibrobacter sp. UWT3]
MNERVMNVAKWSRNVSMSIVLGIFLAACGDDDSSFAPRDEDSSSSICEDCDDASSSSAKSSSSVTPQSSDSETSVSSSSSVKSSSSVASSSSAKSSSSSVKSSSSIASSSSAKLSSSESSSSIENPWGTDEEWWPFSCNAHGGCLEFTDTRNNRTYKYLKFENNNSSTFIYAMVENLNIGEMVWGFKDQKDDSKIERYCYDDDTLNCYYYGALYQWAEMMQLPSECNTKSCADQIKPNHQGICPDGWRLMTADDFKFIINSNGNKDGVKGTRSTFGFGGSNDTGFSLVGAGVRDSEGSFDMLNEYTGWFYPTEQEGKEYRASAVGMTSSDTRKDPSGFQSKISGSSVRCVKLEE